MGTETRIRMECCCPTHRSTVKLNNPLMGTETFDFVTHIPKPQSENS